MKERILKRQEAADFLRIPIRTLDYLVATGQVPFSRIGKRAVRFRKSRLLEFLDQREGVPFNRNVSSGDKPNY